MKKKNKIFRTITLSVFFIIIALLFVNKKTIKLFNRCIEYYDLQRDLKFLKTENQSYINTLSQLESNPSYIQKIAKSEFGFIEKGEVLYIFEKNNKNENENKN